MQLLLTLIAALCVGSKLILYLRQRIFRLKKEIVHTYQQELQSTSPIPKWEGQIQVLPDDTFYFLAEQVNYDPPVFMVASQETHSRNVIESIIIRDSKICLN